jgi:hypothetical protein
MASSSKRPRPALTRRATRSSPGPSKRGERAGQLIARAVDRDDLVDAGQLERAPDDAWRAYERQRAAAIARRYIHVTFAQIDHAAGRVQTRYFAALGGRRQAFPAALLRSLRAIHRAAPSFRSIVLPGHDHCVLPTPAYNNQTVDGVRVRNWVADLVAGRRVADLRPR